MATYIAVKKDYSILKINSINGIVDFSERYRQKNGQTISFASVNEALTKDKFINVYDFPSETLNGLLTGKINEYDDQHSEWKYKIIRL